KNERAEINALEIHSIGIDVSVDLPGMDEFVILLPFQHAQSHDVLIDMLAQGLAYHFIPLQVVKSLLQVGGQCLDSQGFSFCCCEMVHIQIHGIAGINASFYSVKACCQDDGECQIGIAAGIRGSELQAGG